MAGDNVVDIASRRPKPASWQNKLDRYLDEHAEAIVRTMLHDLDRPVPDELADKWYHMVRLRLVISI